MSIKLHIFRNSSYSLPFGLILSSMGLFCPLFFIEFYAIMLLNIVENI